MMKTYSPKPDHIEHHWYVIDASGLVLGRLASEVAAILRGKHKPIYAPHMDCGDNVIVINAGKIELTGGKELKKTSYRHSGYPGGIKGTKYGKLMEDKPAFVIEKAVRGMLPHNRLGRELIRKLHVMPGAEHPHAAQQPQPYTLGKPPVWAGIPAPKPKPARRVKAAAPASKADAPAETVAPAAKKTTAKKPTTKKTTAKKPTAAKKKTTARKPAAKKES
ncbi:MAG: large subunit ribosomal protein [Actinomycetota bacterium]|jgi:large subunit ribosomal protein L13|nr:large subunit ribosomal protein [Actinomycetota bacterium]